VKWLSISFLFLLLLLLLGSNYKIYKVQTESMADVIQPGDYVIVLKQNALIKIKSGDIVAFRKTETEKESVVFVKRAVAQKGDVIISSGAGLIIHSKLYPHDSLYDLIGLTSDTANGNYFYLKFLSKENSHPETTDSTSSNFQIAVPHDSYFMIGDNYYRSMDSRVWGFIKQDEIIGKVVAIL